MLVCDLPNEISIKIYNENYNVAVVTKASLVPGLQRISLQRRIPFFPILSV